jgi:hypothetical protein
MAVVLLAALTAAGCTTDEGRILDYDFQNETSVTVSIARQGSDGHEAVLAPSIAPGGRWLELGDDCRGGTYIARDAAGHEVARQVLPSCFTSWVIANGPIPATLVNDLGRPVTIKFLPWSGTNLVIAEELAPGAEVSVDIASLGDPTRLCKGRLEAFDGRQAGPVADREVETCGAWNWTVKATPSPSASP